MLKQGKFWKFSKVTAKPKVMEKLTESHGIWKAQKGMNPDLCWYLQEVPQSIKWEPASHASHAVHWRIIEKNTIKMENNNMENINWMLTVVNKCLTLNSA